MSGPGWRRGWPEAMVGLLAAVIFLGCLGSVDVWGKREQRASAEVLDTVEHDHWLVAEIQGRPRLEKPPLPRWIIAGVRCSSPAAATSGSSGCPGRVLRPGDGGPRLRPGPADGRPGRRPGLGDDPRFRRASSSARCARRVNDGPLAFFTTLALYAAWRRPRRRRRPGERDGARRDPDAGGCMFYAALGLGFLSQGPDHPDDDVRRHRPLPDPGPAARSRPAPAGRRPGPADLRRDRGGWPAAVAWHDPNAPGLWLMEMSEKTGVFGMLCASPAHAAGDALADMMFPWSIVAMAGAGPAVPGPGVAADGGDARACGVARAGGPSPTWFAWWWAVAQHGDLLPVGGRQA